MIDKKFIKITETHTKWDDYMYRYELEVKDQNGNNLYKARASDSLSECPEDATLGRNLNFAYRIVDILLIIYQAGVNGISIEHEAIYIDEDKEENGGIITREEFWK